MAEPQVSDTTLRQAMLATAAYAVQCKHVWRAWWKGYLRRLGQ